MRYKAIVIGLSLTAALTAALAITVAIGKAKVADAQQQNNRLLKQSPERQKETRERRIALVIGNGAYQNANHLTNATNDAEDVAAALRELGFELLGGKEQLNQNETQMKQLIAEFGEQLSTTHGIGLFYYAGHGVQSQGHNYLIPVEAKTLRERTLEFSAVDVNRILAEMDAAGNGFNVVILDACRTNPFTTGWRNTSEGLTQINAPSGTLIAYATSPGRIASDGRGRNSPYTTELLKQIRVPNLTLEEMFKRVRAGVRQETRNEQTPWEASSLVGEFCFISPCQLNNSNISAAPSATPAIIQDADAEFWSSIKNSGDPEDFRAYKKAFPTGRYAAIADNNLRRLEKTRDNKPIGDTKATIVFDAKSTDVAITFPSVPIRPGPALVRLSRGIYPIQDERGQSLHILMKAQTVTTNIDEVLTAIVTDYKGEASHLWDNKWYFWRLPKEGILLLSWRNLTQNTQGWALVQKSGNVWFYKTNSQMWRPVPIGLDTQLYWTVGRSRVAISVKIPVEGSGWSSNDVLYRFGY